MNLLLLFVSEWLYRVSNRLMCEKMYVQVAYGVLGTVGILKLLTNRVLSSSCRRDVPSCISYNLPRYSFIICRVFYSFLYPIRKVRLSRLSVLSVHTFLIYIYIYIYIYTHTRARACVYVCIKLCR